MDIRPIETEQDYEWALAEVAAYFDREPEPGPKAAARFSVLSALIGAYEDKHYPIDAPTALDGIRATMELTGRTQSDLAKLFGSRSRASELLNGVRPLTLEQARILCFEWGIPAEILLRPEQHAA